MLTRFIAVYVNRRVPDLYLDDMDLVFLFYSGTWNFGERGDLLDNMLAKMLYFKVFWIIYWLLTLVLI